MEEVDNAEAHDSGGGGGGVDDGSPAPVLQLVDESYHYCVLAVVILAFLGAALQSKPTVAVARVKVE